jgi:hypothetical protein
MMLRSTLACTLIALSSEFARGAEPGSANQQNAPASSKAVTLRLEPVHRLKPTNGWSRLVSDGEIRAEKLEALLDSVAFLAVCTNDWPAGLVPVFAVEKPGRFELRRVPPRGLENEYQPLFFALPPAHEPDAVKVAGRWTCQATRGDGSEPYLGWDLAIDGERLGGRFDQSTEYRFAYLTGGTFRSNRIELRVEYTMNVYTLLGEWREGRLKGLWQHSDGSEQGTWEAWREPVQLPLGDGAAALYEWRRTSDDARHYALEGDGPKNGWERAARPLCRVWPDPALKRR